MIWLVGVPYSVVALGLYNNLRFETRAPRWFAAALSVGWGPLVVVSLAGSGPWWPKRWFR